MRNPKEVKEALDDLVSSPGWHIFQEMVWAMHGSDRVVSDLTRACTGSQDVVFVGSIAIARINVVQALQQVLAIPAEYLQAYEQQKAKQS